MRTWIIVVAVLIVSGLFIYWRIHNIRRPMTPVVAACGALPLRVRRVGERYGIQFDVAETEFSIHEGVSDAVPLKHGFGLRPPNSQSLLDIQLSEGVQVPEVDAKRVFSTQVERRTIFNDRGVAIGEDDWGYLNSESWRQVRFWAGGGAKYGFVSE